MTMQKHNPIITEVEKDNLTLKIRERGYTITLSNGKVVKKGIRINQETKSYFGV